jgi:hypothetical protein
VLTTKELQMSNDNLPGDVLGKLAELRKKVGVIKGKKKEGVKFKVRSAEELNDKLRGPCEELGLLIYPVTATGVGFAVEDGTLASINLTLRIMALSDGSFIDLQGFGLGADSQDKAGGKASTYAWKSILLQTLLAGGAEDTDDTDTPIKGGVRAKSTGKPSTEAVKVALQAANDQAAYDAVILDVRKLSVEAQMTLVDDIKAAKARVAASTPAQN